MVVDSEIVVLPSAVMRMGDLPVGWMDWRDGGERCF